MDAAILSTSSITLENPTLNNPTITGSWAGAQHTHASAAQAGSTLGPGVTLSSPAFAGTVSTGAQFAGNLGVGVAPAGWATNQRALQLGALGTVHADTSADPATTVLTLSHNAVNTAGGWQAMAAGGGSVLQMGQGGKLFFFTAPSVAAGAAQTFTTRLQVAQNGTVTLTPDAGQHAIVGTGNLSLTANSGRLQLSASSQLVAPLADAYYYLGYSDARWHSVWSQTGTIQTSTSEAKQDITPLAPEDALAAVRATDPVIFDYRPPERGAEWYELPDDPEQAAQVLEQRMRAAPLEEGARHQAGVVLNHPDFNTDPLFITGEGQTNASNTTGVLLAALKRLDERITALEAA